MARGGRCPACDERLTGAGRFCSACGASTETTGFAITVSGEGDAGVVTAPGERVGRERSPWPVLAVVGVVGALIATLAISRAGDTSTAAEAPTPATTPPPTSVAPPTPAPSSTTTTAPPTTTPAPTTTAPSGFVDVSAVPDDLADTTLLLVGLGRDVTTLDLGTGELTSFESPIGFGTDEDLRATPAGILRSDWGGGRTEITLINWRLEEAADFGEAGALRAIDESTVWFFTFDDIAELRRFDAGEGDRRVRSFEGGGAFLAALVDQAAVVSSSWTGSSYLVDEDGAIRVLPDGYAVGGGHDWYVTVECDDALECVAEIVDLRSDRRMPTDYPLRGFNSGFGASSWDGRRQLVVRWGDRGPEEALLVDADTMAIESASGSLAGLFGPTQSTYDRDLRYAIRPGPDVEIVDLVSGDEIVVEVEGSVREVLVTPEGWEPPVPPADDVEETSAP